MTIQDLSNMFHGQVPDELEHIITEMQRVEARGFKPTIKSCLGASGASGSHRYYYVAADTTYTFDPPCTAVSIKVNLNNHVWYIYFRHGNAWLKRDRDWFASHVANRPLDHLEPLLTAEKLEHWVWSKCGQGIGFDEKGNQLWRLVQDACRRLWEADKVEDPKEPKPNKNRKPREPRETREQRKPRLAKKDVAGPNLNLDF